MSLALAHISPVVQRAGGRGTRGSDQGKNVEWKLIEYGLCKEN